MKVRAKFYVTNVVEHPDYGSTSVEMSAVYSDDPKSENKKFWDATPSASIQMTIKSAAAKAFEVGKEYYVDFMAAE